MNRKITITGVISEGLGIGLKNLPSLLLAYLLWIVTIWVPYINVGTTIAILTIPIALSKGEVINPLSIFDSKYRKYIGEFFILAGLMSMAIASASMFFVIPAIVILYAWSMAFYLLLDKGVSPTEALVMSNKMTYGYKWTIFGIIFAAGVLFTIAAIILALIPFIGIFLVLALLLLYYASISAFLGVIYRELSKEETPAAVEE